MDDSLEKAIRRYLKGNASPDEVKRVEAYYDSPSGEEDYTTRLLPEEEKALEEKIFLSISRRVAARRRQVHLLSFTVQKAAAVIGGLLVVSLLYLLTLSEDTVRIETAFGEVKRYVLPDNSVVILNGNSSIEYGSWSDDEERSVSLHGEAYFSVRHTSDHKKFVVRIPGEFEVEVLGTEFNVTARESNTSVVLNSGAVRLHGFSTDSAIIMKPGERVALQSSRQAIVKTVVDTERYISWKDHKLIFDDTPLREIITLLEETHGYTVTVNDESLMDETFTGAIPDNDINILVMGLNKIGLDVTVNDKRMNIRKR